jgi:hypothetical protein
MSLQCLYDKQWKPFYPLKTPIVYEEETDTRQLSELPDRVYGKLIGGMAGYQPWYIYLTVDKKDVRVVDSK